MIRRLLLVLLALAAPVAEAQDAFQEAMVAYDREEMEVAIEHFREAARDGGVTERLWLAEALRRVGQLQGNERYVGEAMDLARSVLSEGVCSAHAHLLLAEAQNDQFFLEGATSRDSVRYHLDRAIACDPDDGNVWLTEWNEAVRDGDLGAVDRALHAQARLGFWPPAVMAFARWTLGALPPNAILLTNGDGDTYPTWIAQRVEGLRPDVAIVNVSMLNLPEVARFHARVHGLSLPKSFQTVEDRWDPRGSTVYPEGRVYTRSDYVLDHWLGEAEAGRLPRPIVGASTLDPAVLDTKTEVVDRGPYVEAATESYYDAAAALAAVESVTGDRFLGPLVSEHDRSAVRRSRSFAPARSVLLTILWAALALSEDGKTAEAEAAYERAVRFAAAAEIPDAPELDAVREVLDSPTAAAE